MLLAGLGAWNEASAEGERGICVSEIPAPSSVVRSHRAQARGDTVSSAEGPGPLWPLPLWPSIFTHAVPLPGDALPHAVHTWLPLSLNSPSAERSLLVPKSKAAPSSTSSPPPLSDKS